MWIGKAHYPYAHKKVTGEDYFLNRHKIKIGDILLTVTEGELSNLINGGEYKHSAIYVGGADVKYVIESVGRGVVKTDLVTFMTRKDKILCLRPNYAFNYIKITEAAHKLLGTGYDFRFSTKNKYYYCYELCAKILEDCIPDLRLKRKKILGEEVFTYKAFMEKSDFYQIFKLGE
jgi:hypothetical protein